MKDQILTCFSFFLIIPHVFSDCDVGSILNDTTTKISDPNELENRPCDFVLEFGGRGARFTTPEVAARYGFTIEKHEVVTEDGYKLELHRIPAPGKPVVYLIHAYFETSRDFFLNCNRRAIAVRLADEGFDVWLANNRGNAYSSGHVNLLRDDPAYWNFSIDEIAAYDTPAFLDYILNVTGQDKLNWVGYSNGNAIMIAFLSMRPEYNSKINSGFALAAAATLSHTKSPSIRLALPLGPRIEKLLIKHNHGEMLPQFFGSFLQKLAPRLCLPEALLKKNGICGRSLNLLDGYDPNQIDPRVLATMMAGFFSPISVRSFTQWFQWIKNGNLAFFDFGSEKNLEKYNQTTPPHYALNKITSPLIHFWGLNDFLTTPLDVQKSKKYLPHAIQIQVKSPTWNHIDFLFGKDADVYVYNIIIEILKGCYNTN